MRVTSATLRLLGNCLFATGLALVFFLVFLSDGRVLNIVAMAKADTDLLIIEIFCWMMLLGFGWLLTVGAWKHHRALKHTVLMSLLTLTMLFFVFSLLPEATPRWIAAMLAGLSTLTASRITDRILPRASF